MNRAAAAMETPSPADSLDESVFRDVLGRFATGVTVVTMLDKNARLSGFTANSFSSVSLDPPLVLVCVDYNSRSYEHLRDQRAFTIHVLDGNQTWIARRFAIPGADKSTICTWRVNSRGFPVLSQYHTALECRLFREYEGGDHAIIVGSVERLYTRVDNREPLISYRGQLFPLDQDIG